MYQAGLSLHKMGEEVNCSFNICTSSEVSQSSCKSKQKYWGQEGSAHLPREWFSTCVYMYACVSLLQLHSMQSQLEFQEQSMVEKSLVCRQEAKIRELETKLEYERTQIKRLEVR